MTFFETHAQMDKRLWILKLRFFNEIKSTLQKTIWCTFTISIDKISFLHLQKTFLWIR